MRIIILFFFDLFSLVAFSQSQIKFDKTIHHYGPVSSQVLIPAYFSFTNTGNGPLAILLIEKSVYAIVKYENRFYAPGEVGVIQVFYDNNKLGYFRENLRVYTNQSEDPVILKVKGKNVDILECNNKKKDRDKEFCTFYVIDKITKEPVNHAKIQVAGYSNIQLNFTTDRQGKAVEKMGKGSYSIGIEAGEFQPYQHHFSVSYSGQIFIYELKHLVSEDNQKDDQEDSTLQGNSNPYWEVILPEEEYAANNLVLLVDVSLSMGNDAKLELLKESIKQLIDVLRGIDNVSIISYSTEPKILAIAQSGMEKQQLHTRIDSLQAFGITNGVKGLASAYQIAYDHFIADGNNQILLATDGKFTGIDGPGQELEALINKNKNQGIILSIVGFGYDDKAIERMKKITFLGGGKYLQVDQEEDISSLLIEEIKGQSLKIE